MLHCHAASVPPDRDGDGIPDAQEEHWGSDPDKSETLQTIYKFTPRPPAQTQAAHYNPSLDIQELSVVHIAADRYLWRATFKGDVTPSNTVLHLYLNADNNPETGRKDGTNTTKGTDYMISVAAGQARMGVFEADGKSTQGIVPYYYVVGNQLYIMSDSPLTVKGGSATGALYVLCHGINDAQGKASKMSVSSGKQFEFSCAWRSGVKKRRTYDCYELEGFERTFGIAMIREQLYNNQSVIFVTPDRLKLDGFEIDLFTQNHFAHVKAVQPRACATASAPQGRYHAGFLIFDRSGDDARFVMQINGKAVGWAPVNVGNQRYWLYWSDKAFDFQGGEDLSLTACRSGAHQLAGVVFFKTPPPMGELPYKIHHLTGRCPPETSGQISLSWITEMPSLTRLEYGKDGSFSHVAERGVTNTVHRIILTDLDPLQEYSARAVGIRPDGERYVTEPLRFRAVAACPACSTARARFNVQVNNPYDFAVTNQLLTSGFPFPQGALAHSDNVRVLDASGSEIAAQIRTTAWWPDNSVKWILVAFSAVEIPAQASGSYLIEYGREVKRRSFYDAPLVTLRDNLPLLHNCAAVSFNKAGELLCPDKRACLLRVRLQGSKYLQQSGDGRFVIEDNGAVRAVVKVTRDFTLPDGTAAITFDTRYTFWRNSPAVNIQQTFTVQGSTKFTLLEEMALHIPTNGGDWRATTLEKTMLELAVPLHQRFDREYLQGNKVIAGRLGGTALAQGQSVAMRNFWQNYPKALAFEHNSLKLALCPDFEPGLYDAFPFEKEGHHHYFYLLDGVYKFRAGMAKTDEFQLTWGLDREHAAQLATLHQRPLLAVAEPAWYCGSNAFYPLMPRNLTQFKVYEAAIDKNIAAYAAARERQRDYGLMSFGDWYGERGSNWGNSEYDTQSALLLEFVRSGNQDAFWLADEMEKHNRDIDTVHWSGQGAARTMGVGAVYLHQLGHVGGYYTKGVPGTLGIPEAGCSVSHSWNEGHLYHHFLTGDPRSRETALAMAEYYIQSDLRLPYHFTSCRVPGWHLILNAATFAATDDPYYLNASRVIVNRVLELQDKTPIPLFEHQKEPGRQEYHTGGWSRMMVPGHCHCIPRHRGNANFMVAILLSGMKYYYDVTQEPLVKEAIIAGARALVAECYSEEAKGFRYTSCPQMKYTYGTSPLMVEGIARAYLWTEDPALKRPLVDGLLNSPGGGAYGKSFSNYYRMAPRVLADLAQAGITWSEPPHK